MRRLILRFLLIGSLLHIVGACQSVSFSRLAAGPSGPVAAYRFWQALVTAAPDSAASLNARHRYNRVVEAWIRSMPTPVSGDPGDGGGPIGIDISWEGASNGHSGPLGPQRVLKTHGFSAIRIAADVNVEGFDQVVARDGVGVPVIMMQSDPLQARRPLHPPAGDFVPGTAVLEFSGDGGDAPQHPRLVIYNPFVVDSIPVGQHHLPLSYNFTAPLQFSLTDATQDENGPQHLAPSASGEDESKLFYPFLYHPGKKSVVFIHGLRSGPVIWKNSINTLLADVELRKSYQPACFVYPSGLPIPASSARLRQLLREAQTRLDPNKRDPAFDGLILVGHSMGGLLARMQVIDSGNHFWNAFYTASPDQVEAEIDAETRRLVRRALWFRRLPHVKMVVFITTPHRGSEIADLGIIQTLGKTLLELPQTARRRFGALKELPAEVIHPALRTFNDWGNTGVENLSTKHPYFVALAQRPITVPFHSIIGIGDATDPTDATDGVVPYWSAHLKGAASETLLPYPHGCVERQGTVQTLMKILKENREP